MTRHGPITSTEVGVRELHDQLSRYVRAVHEQGTEVVVTMRGKRVARLVPIEQVDGDPLEGLRARGIVGRPKPPLRAADLPAPIEVAGGPVAGLISELRD